MKPADVDFFRNIKPTDMDDAHLHHILQKLSGSDHLAKDILAVQKKLWSDYDIDPFVSVEILVWARNTKGQHGAKAMKPVINRLNDAFDAGKSRDEIIGILRELGEEAAGK